MATWNVTSVKVDSRFANRDDVVKMVQFSVTDLGETITGNVVLPTDSEWLDNNYISYSQVQDSDLLAWVYEVLDSDSRVGLDNHIAESQAQPASTWYERP